VFNAWDRKDTNETTTQPHITKREKKKTKPNTQLKKKLPKIPTTLLRTISEALRDKG